MLSKGDHIDWAEVDEAFKIHMANGSQSRSAFSIQQAFWESMGGFSSFFTLINKTMYRNDQFDVPVLIEDVIAHDSPITESKSESEEPSNQFITKFVLLGDLKKVRVQPIFVNANAEIIKAELLITNDIAIWVKQDCVDTGRERRVTIFTADEVIHPNWVYHTDVLMAGGELGFVHMWTPIDFDKL